MIGREHRFHGRASITRLYARGTSVRTGSLALRYQANPKRRSYRVAVVVSRKVSKSAVVRNRIRRRMYEDVRILSSSLNEPYDLAFTVFDEKVAALPAAVLRADIERLLKKAKLTSAVTPPHAIVEAQRKT